MRSETSPGCTAAARAAVTAGSTALARLPRNSSQAARWGPSVRRLAGCRRRRPSRRSDDPVERADVLLLQQGRVVDPQEAPDGEEGRRPRRAQDVGRLASLEPGVERDQHGPGPEQPEGGEHPLGAVGRPDRHPVTRPRPRRPRSRGRTGRPRAPARRRSAAGPRRPGPRWRRAGRAAASHQAGDRAPGQVGPRVLLVRRRAPDARAHGCWLRDGDDLAGHVGGVVAGQEDDDVGHLPGLGPPAEELRRRRTARSSSGMTRLRNGCWARLGDTALTRTPTAPPRRGAAGQGHDPGLGRRVVGLAGLGPPAEDRGVVDDDARSCGTCGAARPACSGRSR